MIDGPPICIRPSLVHGLCVKEVGINVHVCWCGLYNWGLSYCTIYLSDPCITTPVFKLKLDKILYNKLPTFCIHWKTKTPYYHDALQHVP